jgi:hypothetical protein
MTESLFETYLRLGANVKEARARFEKEQSEANNTMLKLHISIYQDFCCTFTENMMAAAYKTVEDTKYM